MGAWEEILQHVERRVNPHSFATWFRPTRQEDTERDRLVIRVPTRLFRKRLTETYGELLQAVLLEVGLANTRLEFVCSGPEPSPSAGSGAAATATKQARLDFDAVDHQLNPRYTFETFVVGASNQFAHAASRAVAESPSKAYNPLFLYGGVGMGKTHLMQAVGHSIKSNWKEMRLAYVSSEQFTNEVINSLRYDRMVSFREKYRNVDVLLMDDIEFIAGKERTQEEFFHTFNALYEAQRQVVISSDCPPKEIPALEARLRSRFAWGLTADLQAPDLETKMAILAKKAEAQGVSLPDNVATFAASKVKSSIRDLEG